MNRAKVHTDKETRNIRTASARISDLCKNEYNTKKFAEGIISSLKLLRGE